MNRVIELFRLLLVLISGVILIATMGCDEGPDQFSQTSNQPTPSSTPSSIPSDSPTEASLAPSARDREARKSEPLGSDRSDTQLAQQSSEPGMGAEEVRPTRIGRKEAIGKPDRAGALGQMDAEQGNLPEAGGASGTLAMGRLPAPSARLSAGVALPQSLPTGTTMGFSVDYVFAAGQPASNMKTVWVIEMAKRGAAEIPVRLRARGNLNAFVPGARPEHGPFQCYLAVVATNGQRLPISPKVAMKQ